jgi:hypothetical protein
LYTRRVHFVSGKLLWAHYGLIFTHLLVQNNSNQVRRQVGDRLTVGVPFYA